jgi:hypothetical protein
MPGSAYSLIMPNADVVITAEFEPIPGTAYRIEIRDDISHGFIIPSVFSTAAGTRVSFFTAGEGDYVLKPGTATATAGGSSLPISESPLGQSLGGSLYTFTMPAANVRIGGEFEAAGQTCPIWISDYTEHGQITASVYRAAPGTTISLTVTPDQGYELKEGTLRVNTGRVDISGSGLSYSFVMPEESALVSATFEPIAPIHAIAISNSIANGTVTADHAGAKAGITVWLTATPDSAYRLKPGSLTATTAGGGTVTVTGVSSFFFAMPGEDVTVSAEFELIPPSYTIAISDSIAHGTVSANHASAEAGTTVWFTATPDSA